MILPTRRDALLFVPYTVPFMLISCLVIFAPFQYQIRFSMGESMLPEFSRYEFTLVRLNASDLSVGDVIVFNQPYGRPIGHRVLYIGEDYVIVCGDNVPKDRQEFVRYEDLIGRVVAHSPAWVFFSLYMGSVVFFFLGVLQLNRRLVAQDL